MSQVSGVQLYILMNEPISDSQVSSAMLYVLMENIPSQVSASVVYSALGGEGANSQVSTSQVQAVLGGEGADSQVSAAAAYAAISVPQDSQVSAQLAYVAIEPLPGLVGGAAVTRKSEPALTSASSVSASSSQDVQSSAGSTGRAKSQDVQSSAGSAGPPRSQDVQSSAGSVGTPSSQNVQSDAGGVSSPSAQPVQSDAGALGGATSSAVTSSASPVSGRAAGNKSVPQGGTVSRSPLSPPSRLQARYESLPGQVGYVQWRAFIGPPSLKDTDTEFYNWSDLDLEAYDPAAATTVAVSVGLIDMSVTLTDASTWPSTGGVWLGPNGVGQSWGYATYSARTGNVLTLETRDTVDSEYIGTHTLGAVAYFWHPLTNNNGRLQYREDLDPTLCTSSWDVTLSGIAAPVSALRTGHVVLIQIREVSGGTWGSWTTWAVGFVAGAQASEDVTRAGEWTLNVGGTQIAPGLENVVGLHVGLTDAADQSSVTASSTLAPVIKAVGDGEIVSPSEIVVPGQVVDNSLNTGWVSGRFIGEDNPLFTPGASSIDGIRETRGITQVHVSKRVGQGDGYRWIELTFFSDAECHDWLIAGLDHMVYMENAFAFSASAGDRVILAENAELFNEENGENDAQQVIDLSTYQLWNMGNQKFTLTNNATGGTFTLTVDSQTTGGLAHDADAATVQTALLALSSIDVWQVLVTGTAQNLAIKFLNGLGSDNGPGMTVDDGSLTGGTATLTETAAPVFPYDTGNPGSDIFDYLPATGATLRLYDGPSGQGQSQVVWGDGYVMSNWASDWTGSALSAFGTGETARMLFNPSGPTVTADFWDVGNIATPGYIMATGDKEWLKLDFPEMGLKLSGDITDSVPGAGQALSIENAAGVSVEGLPATGTIQIGNEQMTYSARDFDAGTLTLSARGANGTTAAAHTDQDLVYFVDALGVATDAWPIETVNIKRRSGGAVPEDFVIRGTAQSTARNPDQPSYTTDWDTLATVTGNALETYTLDLSATNPRLRYLLIEITLMSDSPSRVKVDEVETLIDGDVLSTDINLPAGTVAEAVTALLDQAGLPSGAIVDAGDTLEPTDYTTSGGSLWPILVDMADFTRTQILMTRDSKLHVALHPFWAGTPTPDGSWGRDEISNLQLIRSAKLGVGALELTWRSETDAGEDTVTAPTTRLTGQTVKVGPYVYTDASGALAGAVKRFWQARRPYEAVMQLAFEPNTLTVGQVFTVTYDFNGRSEIRNYMIRSLNLDVEKFAWSVVAVGVQIDREDQR